MLTRIPKSGTMLTGFVILLPDNFDPAKDYTGILFAHGIGQRGSGSAENVETWMKTECQKLPELIAASNCILIAPELYFNENWISYPDKGYFDFAYSYLRSNYKVGTKVFLEGVSLGGQAIWDWASKHPDLVLGVHATSAVNINVDFCKIKCPVVAHHSGTDNTVGFAQGMIAINNINACGGNAKMYPFGSGHAIWKSDEFQKSVYEQPEVKAFFGMAADVPINPPTPTGLKADASATQTNVVVGAAVILDASKSTGYKQTAQGFKDLVWNLTFAPSGIWNVFPNYNKTGEKIVLQNLVPGDFIFELTARDASGKTSTDTVKITVSPAPAGKTVFTEFNIRGSKNNCLRR
jgi:hypothetical protein